MSNMNNTMSSMSNNMSNTNTAYNSNYLDSPSLPPSTQQVPTSALTSSFGYTHAPSSPSIAPSAAPPSPAIVPLCAPPSPLAHSSSPLTATGATSAPSAVFQLSAPAPHLAPASPASAPSTPQQQLLQYGGSSGLSPAMSAHQSPGSAGAAEPLDRCNVFVKYLPPDMRDEGLYELFAGCGRIGSCKVMLDHKTHSSLGYGFVRFSTAEEALKAIDQMSGHQVGNKTLLCKLSNCTPAPAQAPCNNLYVKPLLTETTEGVIDTEQLKSLFSVFGRVEECRVMLDKRTGRSRQIGFVRFSMLHEATAALKRMNGSRLSPDSLPLIVKYAETDAQKAARRARKLAAQTPVPVRTPVNYFPFAHQMAMPGALYPQMAMPYFTPTVGMGMHMGYAPSLSPYTAGLYAPPLQPALHMPTHTSHHAPALHAAAYYPQAQQNTYHVDGGNLFVFHLPSDIDDTRLAHLFSPFGEVESVKVICDKGSGESKGYGFVKFYRMADAMNAIAYMNGYPLGSKHLKVTFKTATMRM